MGDGSIDLHGLQGFFLLLALGLVHHGAHVVQPVAQLDEDDPHVLGHGHEHLAQIFHLLLFLGGVLHPGQLGHPVHQVGHRVPKLLGDVLVGGGGVLHHVMEQGRHHGVQVQAQVSHDLGYCQGMSDIGGAVLAFLLGVLLVRVVERGLQPLEIGGGIVFFDLVLK